MLPWAINLLRVYSLTVVSFIIVHDVVQAMKGKDNLSTMWRIMFLIPTFIFLANL